VTDMAIGRFGAVRGLQIISCIQEREVRVDIYLKRSLDDTILEGYVGRTFSNDKFNTEEDEVGWHYCALRAAIRDILDSAKTVTSLL